LSGRTALYGEPLYERVMTDRQSSDVAPAADVAPELVAPEGSDE
jgi:hypothetical protein